MFWLVFQGRAKVMRHYRDKILHRSRWFMFVFCAAFCLLPVSKALAGNNTTNTSMRVISGPATISGSPEMTVKTFYTGDDNNNMTILIEWGESGVDRQRTRQILIRTPLHLLITARSIRCASPSRM